MQQMFHARRRTAPWLANVATLIALIGTTWWSSEQRPMVMPQETGGQSTVPAGSTGIRVRDSQAAPAQHLGATVQGLTAGQETSKFPVVLAAWRAPEAAAPRKTVAATSVPAVRSISPIADH